MNAKCAIGSSPHNHIGIENGNGDGFYHHEKVHSINCVQNLLNSFAALGHTLTQFRLLGWFNIDDLEAEIVLLH